MKTMKLVAGLMLAGGLVLGATLAPQALAQPSGKAAAAHENKAKKDEKKADAAVAKLGEAAPEFSLTDTDGKTVKLSDFKGKVVVLEWFNPECPFVVKHHEKNKTFADLYEQYNSKGVVFLAINSGAPGKQGYGKELNAKMKTEWKIQYPILLDESGTTGRAYGARTTPHCFVIGTDGKLAYRGAIDNNNNIDKPGDKNYVKMALDQVLAGKPVTENDTKSYGCGVKYAN